MKKAKDVDEYIRNASKEARPMLKKLRMIVRKTAPKAEEKIGYGLPYYKYCGMLVSYGAFKNHVSLFSLTYISKKFRTEMKKYKTSAGTIQFPLGSKLPESLIKKMIKIRVRENEEKSKKK